MYTFKSEVERENERLRESLERIGELTSKIKDLIFDIEVEKGTMKELDRMWVIATEIEERC